MEIGNVCNNRISTFCYTIYFVGKQKNLFGSTFQLKSKFKTVSGLEVGNNVRFSGINIGTVNEIELITDTSVVVKYGNKRRSATVY